MDTESAASLESHPTSNLQPEQAIDLNETQYFENRELSYIKFNLRVLSQAKDPDHPLLERLMFLLIFSSNLDEFFQVAWVFLRARKLL